MGQALWPVSHYFRQSLSAAKASILGNTDRSTTNTPNREGITDRDGRRTTSSSSTKQSGAVQKLRPRTVFSLLFLFLHCSSRRLCIEIPFCVCVSSGPTFNRQIGGKVCDQRGGPPCQVMERRGPVSAKQRENILGRISARQDCGTAGRARRLMTTRADGLGGCCPCRFSQGRENRFARFDDEASCLDDRGVIGMGKAILTT